MTGNWINDLYLMCKLKLKMSLSEFNDTTLSEINQLLSEFTMYSRLDKLDQAYYISCLVMQEKANDIYEDIKNSILGVNNIERLKKDVLRYKMISERLGIKYPGERVI